MLLPQDARRNKLVCFGIVLADFPCSLIYAFEFGSKSNAVFPTSFLIVTLHLYNDI